ncbi:TraK domain-containing protein [Thiohalocapsa marina]|uniref:TraK domain-containing protein n=1 Tax=Thiohalocapsa marina TaxID=424902 RepID=UPI0036DD596F
MPHDTLTKTPLGAALLLAALPMLAQADSPFLRTASGTAGEGTMDNNHPVLELGPRTVSVSPGSNAVLELAVDHLNRIVTPFRRPSVRTVSGVTTEIDGNVLYVATAAETPATLYITDADDARTTIGLTIAPRRVPPREIRLVVPGVQPAQPKPIRTAEAALTAPLLAETALTGLGREPKPYVEALTDALRALALGEVPPGYQLRRPRATEAVHCAVPGLKPKTEQVLEGGALTLVRVSLRNTGDMPIPIDEGSCRLRSDRPIAAVAAWPETRLLPGMDTGLLLAVRSTDSAQDVSAGAVLGKSPTESLLGAFPETDQ